MVTTARRPTPNHVNRHGVTISPAAPEPVTLDAEGWLRQDLEGEYEGYHLLLDPDELNLGLIEDIETGTVQKTLTALTRVIVGGDIPKGTDRDSLRRLKAPEAAAVVQGVIAALGIPKR